MAITNWVVMVGSSGAEARRAALLTRNKVTLPGTMAWALASKPAYVPPMTHGNEDWLAVTLHHAQIVEMEGLQQHEPLDDSPA